MTFGLLLSIALETVLAAYMVGQFYIYPVSFISGKFRISKLYDCNF